jgi:hypothetical protein
MLAVYGAVGDLLQLACKLFSNPFDSFSMSYSALYAICVPLSH